MLPDLREVHGLTHRVSSSKACATGGGDPRETNSGAPAAGPARASIQQVTRGRERAVANELHGCRDGPLTVAIERDKVIGTWQA